MKRRVNYEDYDLNIDMLKDTLNSFKGKYLQEVPAYSAVKVNGSLSSFLPS